MVFSFELSLLVFLLAIFISQTISIKSRNRLSLPFMVGFIFIIGYAVGLFPQQMVEMSKMKDVGFISINLLIVHTGTMFDIKMLKKQWKAVVICIISMAFMTVIVGFILAPVIGRELALFSPGPIVGNGASNAIASVLLRGSYPQLVFYPWLLFMLQHFFGIPLGVWAIRKESTIILEKFRNNQHWMCSAKQNNHIPLSPLLCDKIPNKYKTTAYYLVTLMSIAVLNKWINEKYLADFGIHFTVTAMIFGIILGNFGIIDKNPLSKSDSMGLLMLGLMALMANTLAFTPIIGIINLIAPALISFAVATVILIGIGILVGKRFGYTPYRSMVTTLNCMVGFPINVMLLDEVIEKVANDEREKGVLKADLMPSIAVGAMLITNTISLFIVAFMANYL